MFADDVTELYCWRAYSHGRADCIFIGTVQHGLHEVLCLTSVHFCTEARRTVLHVQQLLLHIFV